MIKKIAFILLLSILGFVLVVGLYNYSYKVKYSEKLEIKVKPLHEDCDTYNVLWEVSTVSNEEFNYLLKDNIYFTKSKKDYTDNDSLSTFYVKGYLYKKKRTADFIGCKDTWFFEDTSILPEEQKQHQTPNTKLIYGYNISSNQILYQYYEKYGFTDVCTHLRSYFRYTHFKKSDTWKTLPLTQKDINTIHAFPNKVDSLKSKSYSIIYKFPNFYNDISIEKQEYIKDTILISS